MTNFRKMKPKESCLKENGTHKFKFSSKRIRKKQRKLNHVWLVNNKTSDILFLKTPCDEFVVYHLETKEAAITSLECVGLLKACQIGQTLGYTFNQPLIFMKVSMETIFFMLSLVGKKIFTAKFRCK